MLCILWTWWSAFLLMLLRVELALMIILLRIGSLVVLLVVIGLLVVGLLVVGLLAVLLLVLLLAVLLTILLVILLLIILLLLRLLTRVSTTTTIMRLLLLVLLIRRHLGRPTRQINIDPSRVLFRSILKPQFAADLFGSRFDFLNVVSGVVPFPDDPVPIINQ